MKKIKTNIIELDKLYTTPPKYWLKLFKKGVMNIHEFFKIYGQKYWWIYENSPYDLIGWEIEKGLFDWEENSWAVILYCPENFNPEYLNWKKFSWMVAKYFPEKLDPQRYNWEDFSLSVVEYCPDKIEPTRFNWDKEIDTVISYYPEILHLKPKTIKI